METVQGEIKSLAFGGMGILRQDNFVIFVPFTAPGDIVKCQITQHKKNFAFGKVLEFLQYGSERTVPLCPYFGTCGGCQLQHLNYQAQLDYKLKAVQDALQRIAKLSDYPIELIPAAQQWQYRRHITLQIKEGNIGYSAVDHTLLPIQFCPIFNVEKDPIIPSVRRLTTRLGIRSGRVSLYKKTEKYVIHFQVDEKPNQKLALTDSQFSGIVISSNHGIEQCGDCELDCQVESLHIKFSPHAFIQNHPEQSLKIYQKIQQLAQASNCSMAWDLYSGIGITSLLLSQQGMTVYAVEGNPWAVKLAQQNALINNCKGVSWIEADVDRAVHKLPKPDFILANPPRTGLTPHILQTILDMAPKQLIYISCMPSTLARDLKFLCPAKYKIVNCYIVDMFPQTAHIETLVHLKIKE